MHLLLDALPQAGGRAGLTLVVGVGNAWRGDDAAALAVARRVRDAAPPGVRVVELEGEPAGLLDEWQGEHRVVLVDAVRSGAPPGTLHRLDAARQALPAEIFHSSTHHLGVADAVELARALGRLPERLDVYGIEGRDFGAGDGLSPEVEAAVERLATELCALSAGSGPGTRT